MKLTCLLSLITLTVVTAHPIATCEEQSECIKITKEKVVSDLCDEGDCEFEICLTIDLEKCPNTPSIDHICKKSDSVCLDGGGFAGVSTKLTNVEDGYQQCQIVPPGGVAEFLLKDGNNNALGGCGEASKIFEGIRARCGALGEQSCTGPAMIGKECMWTFRAPRSCGNFGGGHGDPHIKKWDGRRFPYHGECDLLLVHSDEFADNAGFDLQIRTTIKDFYSFIESAALRIGESVMEITMDRLWIDGQEISDDVLPITVGGYTLEEPFLEENAKVYRVDLEHGDYVEFRAYKFFLSVDVAGNQERFENSIGLLGDYNSGAMVGRDGQTVFDDTDAYGQEWQVRAEETMLFQETREPQLPHARCIMPQATGRRRTSSIDMSAARDACAGKSDEDFEFCVSDVLATGDLGMAGAW